ncbi:hypothetical protein [uncultured Thiodictyon sp.]|uniref:hypothetical protein n=1 Tax=uncultured Thiodictyon sp. TaxID=1846217 RepID=UPI0025E715FD|nr:hypothetical protein [uncultured Thiodictyon sp.]
MTQHEFWQQRALAERGMILAVLYNAPAPSVDLVTIRGCLDLLGMPTQAQALKRHMLHLAQRGYLTAHSGFAMGISLENYELTPDGRDLVIGARTDPGVSVPSLTEK